MSTLDAPKPSEGEGNSRKNLSILVVQMGGVEEVLRSLMALKAIKHLYPEIRLQVMARPGSADPLKRVEWIDQVLETPKFQSGEEPLSKTALWINEVINQNYDILANWTSQSKHSRMAAIATSLIPAVVKLGDYIREDMTQGSHDAWSMYRASWLQGKVEQDIHYTDLVTTQLLTALQIHAGDPSPDVASSTVTSKYFFKTTTLGTPITWMDRPKGLKWIAIHTESAPERAPEWMEMVLRRNPDYGILLIGDQVEFETSENARVIRIKDEIHFDALVTILSQCSWLLSGQHPIVDLASLINLRVFYSAIPEGRAFNLIWTETGPYGNGHVSFVSQDEWKPELAYAAWSYYQSEWFHKNSLTLQGHFENLGLAESLKEIQIYKSRIRPSSEGGGVCYEQSAGKIQEFEAWIYRVRGQMARAWFCGWLPSIDQEVAKLSLSPGLIKRIRSVNESILVIERLVNESRATAVSLANLAQKTKNSYLMSVEDRTHIEESGKKLLEVEELMSRVTHLEPEMHCLLMWYQQLIHNLSSETLFGMAKETVQAFDLVTEGLDLLAAYTQKTLERAKPKSVSSSIHSVRNQDLNH
jgi:hypothetical protein